MVGWYRGVINEWVVTIKGALLFSVYGIYVAMQSIPPPFLAIIIVIHQLMPQLSVVECPTKNQVPYSGLFLGVQISVKSL